MELFALEAHFTESWKMFEGQDKFFVSDLVMFESFSKGVISYIN